MLVLKALAPGNAVGVLYLIGVLIVATGWGPWPTVTTAVLSAVAFNCFRSWPEFGMALTQLQDWAAIFVFLIVALVANALARIARTRAADAEQRRREAEASREELGVLAEQQAALRRVATLVARGVPASEIFPAVAHELARSLDAANASLWRYESDGTATLVAARDDPAQAEKMPVGTRWPLEGENIAAMVAESGRPARMDSHDAAAGVAASLIRRLGLRGGVGAPIVVEGRLWGVAVVGAQASHCRPMPSSGWVSSPNSSRPPLPMPKPTRHLPPPARASSRPPTMPAAAWSATCTTARNSGSFRLRCNYARSRRTCRQNSDR